MIETISINIYKQITITFGSEIFISLKLFTTKIILFAIS